jgi:predicted phosphoribosyltransferase
LFVDRSDAGRQLAEKLLWVREEAKELKGIMIVIQL